MSKQLHAARRCSPGMWAGSGRLLGASGAPGRSSHPHTSEAKTETDVVVEGKEKVAILPA